MKINQPTLIVLCVLLGLSFSSRAELQDQGLNSILLIIDKAIDEITSEAENANDEETVTAVLETANATVVNLSRTLGTLSYSRLQCGETDVLSESTQRVQRISEQSRDAMRDAFQEGFDKSASETKLLSEDECKRLNQSRIRTEIVDESNVKQDQEQKPTELKKQEVVEEVPDESPRLKYLRIAELSGQLAFKTKICRSKKVFTQDYNEFINGVPEAFQEEVKNAYWKGYKHGKRLNRNLTKDQC